MTQEDKELLLKDLSARLPYGVFCVGITYELDDDGERYIPVKVKDTLTEIHNYKLETASVRLGLISSCKLETVKPYLRRLSSMTKKETKELFKEIGFKFTCNTCGIPAHYHYEFAKQIKGIPTITNVDFIKMIDWLNAHHFDYRGLIGKGLALEAPNDMYMT